MDRLGRWRQNCELAGRTIFSTPLVLLSVLRAITVSFISPRTHQLEDGEMEKTVLVIVGMPGAGKSLASHVASQMKIPVFVSGDIIREEARRKGLTPDKKNLGQLMLKIRRTEGMGAVAKRVIPMIEDSASTIVVYEGARSFEEIDALEKRYQVWIIAIHASPGTRFRRLMKRRRSDRPRTMDDFSERDRREVTVGVGKVIALADRMLENEDSRQDLRKRMRRVLIAITRKRSG